MVGGETYESSCETIVVFLFALLFYCIIEIVYDFGLSLEYSVVLFVLSQSVFFRFAELSTVFPLLNPRSKQSFVLLGHF
jgi:hypothetical protein